VERFVLNDKNWRDVAQTTVDKAVTVLQASDAGELLPRSASDRDSYTCRFCPFADRCWED
ncbi:MAG: hypothetical protein U9P12_09755, partial [Verrucomicrobiota bacterium]|nr:hypothetical protein [Verrucomicrobiota bacterium]